MKWPFRGDITVQLLNQMVGGHYAKAIDVTDNAADAFCKRVVLGERSPDGWGFLDFICHTHLQPLYLKDDCLNLCIKEVKLKC